MGTSGYAAPEQHMGRTTPKSDIFALGKVMYQLLTGVNRKELVSEILIPIRKYNPKYSKELERIVEKCTRPNQRFANCDELIKVLKKEQFKMNKKGLLKKLGLKK